MDFLKSGIKTVLGATDQGQQRSPAETVEKLVDHAGSSTLLDDRRDACRALKALSRKYRVEVGAQGMSTLMQILQNDRQDCEIVNYALETLCNIMSPHEFDEEADNPTVSVNIGEQFTEMFLKNTDHVTIIMNYLEEYDFRVRRVAIQLLTTLIQNKTRELQEHILISPMGISKLMDLLSDKREVIRNDALLLLIQLSKGNSNIQKIIVFENAFDKIFDIIKDEGSIEGGIIVEDCLFFLINLLKNNSSNQAFFKEGTYIQRLTSMFDPSCIDDPVDQDGWAAQKIANVHCVLQVIRSLVTPSNQQIIVSSCQDIMRKCGLLEMLCHILMGSGVPADVLQETINTVAEVIRGNSENQEQLSKVMAPSTPARPVIVVLLMTMINEKQLLALRCSVLYSFQCYLYRNPICQQSVVQTLLPCTIDEVSALSPGQLLCTGLFSTDAQANWFSANALMHTLVDNVRLKEELLRVLLATPGANKPVTLLEQCICLLHQDKLKLQSKVGLLMFLSMWVAHCPNAVKTLLQSSDIMAYLTGQIGSNEHDENERLLQGLCAFLLGLCIQFNDNTLAQHKRDDLCQLIIKRIGQENFCNKLNEVSRHEAYSRACKQPQIRAKSSGELLLDYEFCKLFKNLEALIAKIVSGFDVNGVELAELSLNSEAAALVAQYKNIIRGLDGQITGLQEANNQLEAQNSEQEQRIAKLEALNQQISDQNTLLKAQLAAIKNHSISANTNDICQQHITENNETSSEVKVNTSSELYLQQDVQELQKKLEDISISAKDVNEKYQKLQKDQENLLELLAYQDLKLKRYANQMRTAGLSIEDDDNILDGYHLEKTNDDNPSVTTTPTPTPIVNIQ